MIVYSSTKSEFRQDVHDNRIEESILKAYRRNLGHSTGKSEPSVLMKVRHLPLD